MLWIICFTKKGYAQRHSLIQSGLLIARKKNGNKANLAVLFILVCKIVLFVYVFIGSVTVFFGKKKSVFTKSSEIWITLFTLQKYGLHYFNHTSYPSADTPLKKFRTKITCSTVHLKPFSFST